MISTDFAPNEQFDDAWLSLKLIFQPWRWQNGKEIDLVKLNISHYLNIPISSHISLFLSGRSALYHLIKSFNLPDQSQIIVQAFTCEAVVLPIIEAKAQPVYIDIEKETLSMDLKDLEKKIDSNCRVLILQHTFGLTPKNREAILKLAQEKNIIIIEDLAHGFAPEIFKSHTLISSYPHIYYLLSFGRSKPFSSVFGGVIISFEKKLNFKLTQPAYSQIFNLLLYKPIALLIKLTYNIFIGKLIHKITNNLRLLSREISNKEKRGEYDLYFDKAYPNALAILLLHQLNKFNQMQEKRLKIVEYYLKNLKIESSLKIENCKLKISSNAILRFPLLVDNRDEIIEKARQNNVFLGLWYNQVVAPKSLDLNKVFYQKGSCPVAENICDNIINLPTLITEKEAKKICTLLEK